LTQEGENDGKEIPKETKALISIETTPPQDQPSISESEK
jgi:hypothetical protein